MAPAAQFHVISLFPELIQANIALGVVGRAVKQGLAEVQTSNPRSFAPDARGTVDGRPFGGGPGMVMQPDCIHQSIVQARKQLSNAPVIYLTPQGERLSQSHIEWLRRRAQGILLCGRYEGIDQRVLDREVDLEWSLGDFVLSGAELAAAAIIDSVVRRIPGALGKDASSQQDSFQQGLLDYPHYTRPEIWQNIPVPDVLLSGDHAKIESWRRGQALLQTWRKRPDLLMRLQLSDSDRALLKAAISAFQESSSGNV